MGDCNTCANKGRINGLSQETYCDSCVNRYIGSLVCNFSEKEKTGCKHEFGEQYRTQYKDIYGKKCKKCGHINFDKGEPIADCGCRFENSYSSAIVLCDECSKLPCHNKNT